MTCLACSRHSVCETKRNRSGLAKKRGRSGTQTCFLFTFHCYCGAVRLFSPFYWLHASIWSRVKMWSKLVPRSPLSCNWNARPWKVWVRDRHGKPRGTPLKVSLPFPCPTLPLSGVSLRWAPLSCACLFITDCRDDNEHCADAIKEYKSESYDYCKDTDESIQEYVKAHCRLSCGFCE